MKTIFSKLLLIFFALTPLAVANPYSYIKLSDTNSPDLFSKRLLIEAYGGRIIHEFPPNEFICEIDTAQFRILSSKYALDATQDSLSRAPQRDMGISVARFCYDKLTTTSIPPSSPTGQLSDTLPFTCGTSSFTEQSESKQPIGNQALSISRLEMFNANYLVGKTAVCIVLPEGPSGTHDWEQGEDWDAIGEVIEAYDKLSQDAASRNIDVTWTYELHFAVPVTEEPIDVMRPSSDVEFGWLNDINSYLGVGSEWNGLFETANRLRQQYQTDWGLTYYVVKNNPYEYFEDSYAGYTIRYKPDLTIGDYFSAPFAISVFNRGFSHVTSDLTIAHETLHIFGTPDEYAGGGNCKDADDCGEGHGFLYVLNSNCAHCEGEKVRCIMQGSTQGYHYCESTIGQIGWSDSDSDGHPDAIDLNNNYWTYFENIQPGDMINVQTISGAVVRNIAVTANKMDATSGGSGIYYDCANYQSQEIAPDQYYVSVNGGGPSTWGPMFADASIIPSVHSIFFDQNTGLLTWELTNSFAFIDLNIKQLDDLSGDTLLLAKHYWNKFFFESTSQNPKLTNLADIYCDPCIAEFSAWRSDGNVNAPTVSFQYSNPYPCCGLYTGGMTGNTNCDISGLRNLSDITRLIDHVYGTKAPLCCHNNGNTDGSLSSVINLADINRLMDHVYLTKAETAPCP